MSEKNEYIYFFLHIPKTAGFTFQYHLEANLKKDEYLVLSYDVLGLNSNNPPVENRYYKNAANKYLSAISKKKREKLKVVYGHTVPYGIHELFEKQPRYIAFFRNPINRTVSLYNDLIRVYEGDYGQDKKIDYLKLTLLKNEKIPSFGIWLKEKYNPQKLKGFLTMSGYLKIHGYLSGKVSDDKELNKALKRFYFVGITENYNKDSLYLYNKLKFNKFFIDQNISRKVFKLDSNSAIEEILRENKSDYKLYKKALLLNKKFKEDNKDYYKSVRYMGVRRNISLPFTQLYYAKRQSMERIKQQLTGKVSFFSRNTKIKDNY